MIDYNYKVKAIRVFNLNYPWIMVEKKTNRVVDNANGEGVPNSWCSLEKMETSA